jgi:hypothetical protein
MSNETDKRIEELLERVARAQMEAIQDLVPDEGDQSAPFSEVDFVRVLRRELGPLLKAGQAMRDLWGEGTVLEPQAWDAALGGSEESDGRKA